MVTITINGEATDVPDGFSLSGLVDHLGLSGGPVAIEQNGAVVPRAAHATTLVKAGDVLEIVHFVGGG